MRLPPFVSLMTLSACVIALPTGCDDSEADDGSDETIYCSDAESADNQDGDGDGFSPCQGDCDDSDADFYPDAPDADGDRIDHNCDNWMPERT